MVLMVLRERRIKFSVFTPTYVLVAANVAAYVLTSVIGGSFIETNLSIKIKGSQIIISEPMLLAQCNLLVMHGWYWQLFTSMFVHADLLHLFGNMLFLLVFGLRAEDLFSDATYLFIYFGSGLLGNVLTLLMPLRTISVGASGAIFGLFGACVIYLGRAFGRSITVALIYSFYLLLWTTGAGVNVLAHFGGLVAGLLIGYVLATRRKLRFEEGRL